MSFCFCISWKEKGLYFVFWIFYVTFSFFAYGMTQCILWHSVLYGTVYCVAQFILWQSVLYSTVYCMVQCIVWHSLLYGAVHWMAQCVVWLSLLYGAVHWKAQCIVWHSLLYGTVYCVVMKDTQDREARGKRTPRAKMENWGPALPYSRQWPFRNQVPGYGETVEQGVSTIKQHHIK